MLLHVECTTAKHSADRKKTYLVTKCEINGQRKCSHLENHAFLLQQKVAFKSKGQFPNESVRYFNRGVRMWNIYQFVCFAIYVELLTEPTTKALGLHV
jgi:hypothetical protein